VSIIIIAIIYAGRGGDRRETSVYNNIISEETKTRRQRRRSGYRAVKATTQWEETFRRRHYYTPDADRLPYIARTHTRGRVINNYVYGNGYGNNNNNNNNYYYYHHHVINYTHTHPIQRLSTRRRRRSVEVWWKRIACAGVLWIEYRNARVYNGCHRTAANAGPWNLWAFGFAEFASFQRGLMTRERANEHTHTHTHTHPHQRYMHGRGVQASGRYTNNP